MIQTTVYEPAASAAPTYAGKILGQAIAVEEQLINNHISKAVRKSVEQTLNAMLDLEPEQLCNAKCYGH
jgi:hypothetical protein